MAVSIEPDGDTIRKALKAKAVSAPVLSAEVSVAQLLPIVHPDLKPDELKALLKEAFGEGSTTGKDTIKIRVEGGEQLTIKFQVKGKAVRAFAVLQMRR
jgi:hypothetical protein